MQDNEIELLPVDFITINTVGPKGQRVFYLQAGKDTELVTMIIEKQHAQMLVETITTLLDTLKQKQPELSEEEIDLARWDMSLRDPLEPSFRVEQMGLGYDEEQNLNVLVVQELMQEEERDLADPPKKIVRLWTTHTQMRALIQHTQIIVEQGRANPKSNGHIIYYWIQ